MKRVFSHPGRPKKPTIWRSLAERDNTAEFEKALAREFPAGADQYEGGTLSKRDFMRLMGASVALASITGCRRPEAYLVPYNKGVEWTVPGKFLYYASAMPIRQGAMPLVVSTVDGRPTKLEGNPRHPDSNGGTDGFTQASILNLYDPHRSKKIRREDREASAEDFAKFLATIAEAKAAGLAFLAERTNSPTRDRLRGEIEKRYPDVIWCEYEPLGDDLARQAVWEAFGEGVRLQPRFEKADVVLALDSDFLNPTDMGVRYAEGFFARRNPDQKDAAMNRLYVVENHYSTTGGMADHRLRCAASQIGAFARQLGERIATKANNTVLMAALAASPAGGQVFDTAWGEECAADLLAHAGRSLILVGGQQPLWVQSLVLAINGALGSLGATLVGLQTSERGATSIEDLAAALAAGSVKSLFILGGNPVYNAPANLRLAELLAKVPEVVRLGLFEDETSRLSRWHVPSTHYLESWGDVRTYEGTYTAIQPMILPLWGGVSELEILAQLLGQPVPEGPTLVKETFTKLSGSDEGWTGFLRNGFLPESRWPAAELKFSVAPKSDLAARSVNDGGLELVFLASSSVDDGRYANNSWLQETPDFETKVTWDNVVLVSPATAKKLGVRANNFGLIDQVTEKLGNEIDYDVVADVIEITAGGESIRAAALVAPGHADDSLSLALGYGRKGVSALMEHVGFDAYPLRTSDSPRFRTGISVRLMDEKYPLARTQEHRSMEGRDLVREGTRERYEKEPTFAATMGMDGHLPPNISLYQNPPLTAPEQWGMTVDLNTCIGCNACVVACQAENNVPVVGKEQVRRNRDMAWIRIDRYFAGEIDEPEMLAQAIMCQHCENAPCETVCPVNATVHSEEGLNLMAYNRCIGTRYCANNCPWKVRRFNFFDYNQRPLDQLYDGPLAPKGMADSLQMVKNPNVTVRMRGVMEKCTFCIQRIEEAKISRMVEAGPRNKNEVPIREFQSACQQACPAGSLVFGNINDPKSRVAKERQSDRRYTMLKYLNTEPRVIYLARIKNPNMRMPGADRVGMANGVPHSGEGHHE